MSNSPFVSRCLTVFWISEVIHLVLFHNASHFSSFLKNRFPPVTSSSRSLALLQFESLRRKPRPWPTAPANISHSKQILVVLNSKSLDGLVTLSICLFFSKMTRWRWSESQNQTWSSAKHNQSTFLPTCIYSIPRSFFPLFCWWFEGKVAGWRIPR